MAEQLTRKQANKFKSILTILRIMNNGDTLLRIIQLVTADYSIHDILTTITDETYDSLRTDIFKLPTT